jgi:tape measure domain
MAAGNQIVTKTVNRTTFEVDKNSYNRAVKQIRQVGKEWEKSSEAITKPKKDPAKAYDKSAAQMRLVNKRLAETRMREEKRASDYSIALAKKEARAKAAIAKVQAARIKQHVKGLTSANPGTAEMRKFYQAQERAAKAAGRKATTGMNASSRPMNINRINSVQLPPRGGFGTGMVGDPNKPYNPELISRQNAEMARHIRSQSKIKDRNAKIDARNAAREAARSARIDDVMSQQRIRLSSKYGRGYAGALGKDSAGNGIADLNKQFKAGTLSSGQYRQSIQSLERQFRSAQANAGGFGAALGNLRSQMVSAGAAYGVFAGGRSIMQQGQFFQGLDATMLMVSDSSEEAGKRIQFVKDQSMRLGLSLKEASQGYTQMSIAADGVITKQQNDDLFKGFSEYSTALQVDPVKYQRGITAIQQMMGKGQIMAEELKQQLAEGIPGSLQVFVKATQEAFGDSTIDVQKLMDMMQKGELKAAKVMPFVAKYYAEAARKGGALDKSLEGNRVALNRLGLTWMDFQNKIFEGKFGEQLTRIFNDLAKVLGSNGELATNIGDFLGNIMEGFWDMVTEIHDDLVFLDRIFGYYAAKFGVTGDTLKEAFSWAGYVAGMALFVGGLNKIFAVLSKIAGLRGALVAIRTAMGGAAAAGGPTAMGGPAGSPGGPMGPPKPASFLERWKGLGKLAKIGILGEVYAAGSMFNDQFVKRGDDRLADAGLTPEILQQSQEKYGMMPKPVGLLDVFDEWFNSPRNLDAPTIGTQGPGAGIVPPAGIPFPAAQQPIKGEMTIKIDAGELRNIVKAVVDENEGFNFNLLTQGGN